MSNSSRLGAIEYMAESSFAETSTTFSTHRLPIIGEVDCSGLTWDKQDPQRTEQYLQGGSQHVLMGQGGSFRTKLDLCGHGVTTAGSPSLDAIETLFGYVFGNVALSASASQTLTGGTASVPTTSAASGFTAGSLCRVGALGDNAGNGQMYPIATQSSSNLNLLAALSGSPTNGDVLYPTATFYTFESPPANGINATVPGLRFRALTANLQYSMHGCFPTAMSLSGLNSAERPQAEITWQVARWAAVSATFPSAVTSNQYNPAPIAAGSLFVADVGTATRTTRTYRNFTVDFTLGMVPLMGPGGVGAYQTVVGCRRVPSSIKISWVEDADSVTASPVLQGYGTGTTSKHIMWTGSTTPGSAIGMYFPKVCFDNVPVQFNDGGINRMRISGMAYTGGTTTTDLTASAFRMGWG